MKNLIIVFLLVLSIQNEGYSQRVSGKKLVKAVSQLEREGEYQKAIDLMHSNFSNNGKYQNELVLKLADNQVKIGYLDSANNTLSQVKIEELDKLNERYQELSSLITKNKEQYEVAIALANKNIQSENYDAANLSFKDALKYDQGNYKAWFGLGEVQSLKRAHQEAINIYLKASLKFYDDQQELVHTYEHLAEEYLALRNPIDAIKVCEKAELINNMDPGITFFKGKAMFYQRDFELAIGVLSSAILLDKSYPDGYFYRGSCYYEMKNYDLAIDDFSKVISLKSLLQESYYQRAHSYFYINNFKNAENDFRELGKLEEQHFYASNAIGVCEYKQHKYSDAVNSFSKAIEFIGKDSVSINIDSYKYNLALAFQKNKQNSQSILIIKELASQNKSNPVYNIVYVQMLVDNGNLKEADKWVEESLKINPSVKEYYELAILIANKQGDTDKAGVLGFDMSRVHGDSYNLDVVL